MRFRRLVTVGVAGLSVPLLFASAASAVSQTDSRGHSGHRIDHIVVIYEENHSFDNLFGGWERVDGLAGARAQRQIAPDGARPGCLPQGGRKPPPPPPAARLPAGQPVSSAFGNRPFSIDDFIAPEDTTCPAPGQFAVNGIPKGQGLPGGCTRDLVHRYYQEQYQINGGRMNRYVAGSDAVGLTMGHYDTRGLPVYEYLHGRHAPHYAVADRLFQAAFGGSFLHHQRLLTPYTPTWPRAVRHGGADDLHSVVGPDGYPAAV